MLEGYLVEVAKMLAQPVDIGYACWFNHSWQCSPGATSTPGQDHITGARSTRAESMFEGRPCFMVSLSTAFQRAVAPLQRHDPELAAVLLAKHRVHLTLAGEWRSKPPYVFMIEREILTDLADGYTREDEHRHMATRGLYHFKRMKEHMASAIKMGIDLEI